MEYPQAETMVFDAAIAGVKNILGDMAGVIVALISILLIVYALHWIVSLLEHRDNEKELGGVEDDISKRKYSEKN